MKFVAEFGVFYGDENRILTGGGVQNSVTVRWLPMKPKTLGDPDGPRCPQWAKTSAHGGCKTKRPSYPMRRGFLPLLELVVPATNQRGRQGYPFHPRPKLTARALILLELLAIP
jgi:hypothetical protein